MLGSFKDKQLYIELRPQCPKCKKEFMLDLKKFLPGRAHSCYACGTVAQFDRPSRRRCRSRCTSWKSPYERYTRVSHRAKGTIGCARAGRRTANG